MTADQYAEVVAYVTNSLLWAGAGFWIGVLVTKSEQKLIEKWRQHGKHDA